MANNEEIKNEEQVLESAESANVKTEANENVASQNTKEVKVEGKANNKNDKTKLAKDSKDKKTKKSKDKKVSGVSKTLSELKKVTWPTFGQVVKQTSIVIVVTLAFLLVVFGLDRLCSLLVGLIAS